MIKVDLDRGASASEVEAVRQAFKDAGMDAEIRAEVESRSELPPWMMYVAVLSAAIFWRSFLDAAGADAWRGLRDLITKLFRARDESKSPKGSVVVTITEVHERIVFSDGLPDEAFRTLIQTKIEHTPSGQIGWDQKTGSWRDPLDKS